MQRWLLIIGIALALLLLITFGFMAFTGNPTDNGSYALFPQSGDRNVPDMPTPTYVPDDQYLPPAINNPQEVPPANPQSVQPSRQPAPLFSMDFLAALYARYRSTAYTDTASGGTGTQGAGTGVPYSGGNANIGITYTQGSGGGETWTPPSDWVTGGGTRNNDRNEIEFNPMTGDLWVAGTHFNFTGMQTIANNTTSDVVGDPDNFTLGTTLGTLVGSLLGDPGLGLIVGTALGSNLYNGFTLQDLGIGLDNGVPTFGGESILDGGLGGGGDDDFGGMGEEGECAPGQGESGFGGYGFAMECTCSTGTYVLMILKGDYAGNYLIDSKTKRCNNAKDTGYFNAFGSYTPGTGSGQCEMETVYDCTEVEIDKGTITVYGTSIGK